MRTELVDLRSEVALAFAGFKNSVWLINVFASVLAWLHPRVQVQALVTVSEMLHHRVVKSLGREGGFNVDFPIRDNLRCFFLLFLLHDRVFAHQVLNNVLSLGLELSFPFFSVLKGLCR